jgi:uncharacterized protein YbjT (DUF2867 family)
MIAAQTALAVTGSTGRLGGRVASGLSQLGIDHRLVVRDPAHDIPEVVGHPARSLEQVLAATDSAG